MNIYEEVRRKVNCAEFLEESKSGLYICPYCGSGTGKNSTGAVKTYYKDNAFTFYCHKCGKSGDAIDLYQMLHGVDSKTAVKELAAQHSITAEAAKKPTDGRKPISKKATPAEAESVTDELIEGVAAYWNKCAAQIGDTRATHYLSGRGISVETARKCYIGFDPVADIAGHGHPAARIIIPNGGTSYIGRAIDPDTPKEYQKMNSKGQSGLFNVKALYGDAEHVFITEGAFDALSIIEAGGEAVALNSTSNVKKLLAALDKQPTKATLLLSLDSDEAGKKATTELKTGLASRNISYEIVDISGGCKDPNEALVKDRSAFLAAVEAAQIRAEKPDSVALYINTEMGTDIERNGKRIFTGFDKLDEISGGLYAGGLYVLAAISSLGKTTFAQQMGDQIAAAGTDVLFFSMEMSRLELTSKSLARTAYTLDPATALPSVKIRSGYSNRTVDKAVAFYLQAVGDRLSIIEGSFTCDIAFIGAYIRNYIEKNGTKPVVIIDYLQILQPSKTASGKTQSTKETVDAAVTELKRLCRELSIAIIVISSLNRANYTTLFDFTALKESGGIEYTADVVWGMQLQVLHEKVFESDGRDINKKREAVNEAKAADPRKIELVCVKNRYGISSYSVDFDYHPKVDYFEETAGGKFPDLTHVKEAKRL